VLLLVDVSGYGSHVLLILSPLFGIGPQANGIQSFDQVQIGACLLDLLAKVGGADIGLLQDAACFSEATLFLEVDHERQPVSPLYHQSPLAQSGGTGQAEQERRGDDQGCRCRVPSQPA